MPSTAWLWSCIQSRYSDAMDAYPTMNIKPRQFDDKEEAKKLSSILPIVFEQNRYEETYSDIVWYTLKHGGSIQGIFWDNTKHNGLGDISIKKIDLLNFYWEPGVTDLQQSSNIFTTELVDNKLLEQRYPEVEGKLGAKPLTVAQYMYDDKVDTTDKSVVIDWYYHTEYNGKRTVQYVKYVNDIVLYATENMTEAPIDAMGMPVAESLAERGLYDHALYPFVAIALYPIEGSICGYGLTDIGRDTQLQIDLINKAITDNALDGTQPRYFVKANSAVNEEEYLDRQKKLVHVEGSLDEYNMRPIDTKGLDGIYVNFLQLKEEELKYVTSNQDVNNGSTTSGVTAASAIAALQETAGKNSRSSNKAFYRGYREVVYQVIELIRQFYDIPRTFRIAPDALEEEDFVTYSNENIRPQNVMIGNESLGLRLPEFDVDVTAEKQSPYKKMEMNELALNFYNIGFFNPQMADQALACLSIMDFEHKEEIIEKISENQTLQDRLLQVEQIALELAKRTDPNLANQIAQMIMAESGAEIPTGSANVNLEGTEEPSHVEKARDQARDSTQI